MSSYFKNRGFLLQESTVKAAPECYLGAIHHPQRTSHHPQLTILSYLHAFEK
jgi:hypothetical protein